MVAVPVLDDLVFGSTTSDTLPLPVPLPPEPLPLEEMLIQFTLLLAVHLHPLEVETETVNTPPTALASRSVGLIAYEQRFSVCVCVTVNVSPATVIVPVRVFPERPSTLNATVPFPAPVAPEVIAIHPALLVALHEQPAAAETARVPLPPVLGVEKLVGLIEYEHVALPWFTVNVAPATPIRPARAEPVFEATRNLTAALPLLLAPSTTVIHCTELSAVHVHPAAEVTLNIPDPPAAGIATELGLIDAEQFCVAPPLCLTVTASPPRLIAPLRSEPLFGITSNRTFPLPVPLVEPLTTIHPVLEDALHVQPSGTVIDTVAVPPFASKRSFVAAS